MQIDVEQLADALAERVAIPFTARLWDMGLVATYLKVSKSQAGRYAARPDFPKAVRLPTDGRGTPRYQAKEVIAWAEGFTEKN